MKSHNLLGGLLACCLLSTVPAFGEFTFTGIALKGQQELITGGTFTGTVVGEDDTFKYPASSASEEVLFGGNVDPSDPLGITTGNNNLLLLTSEPIPVAREGALAESGSNTWLGRALWNDVDFSELSVPSFDRAYNDDFQDAMDNNGAVAFATRVQRTGVNDKVYLMQVSGTFVKVARQRQAAPQTTGSFYSMEPFAFANGQMVFAAEIDPASGANFESLYSYTPANGLKLMLRTGTAGGVPFNPLSITNFAFADFGRVLSLTEDGRVAFLATFTGQGVDSLNNSALFIGQLDASTGVISSLTAPVREAAFISGTTGEKFGIFNFPAVNTNGTLVFKAQLRPGATDSLWVETSGSSQPKMVARVGEPITLSNGETWTIENFGGDYFQQALADNDDVIFRAQLTGTSGTSAVSEINSIWRYRTATDELHLIVREGQENPSREGSYVCTGSSPRRGLENDEVAVNRDGSVAFVTTTETDAASYPMKEDLWIDYGVGNPVRVLGEDGEINVFGSQYVVSGDTLSSIDIGEGISPSFSTDDVGRKLTDGNGFAFRAELKLSGSQQASRQAVLKVGPSGTPSTPAYNEVITGYSDYCWPTVNDDGTSFFEAVLSGTGVTRSTDEIYALTRNGTSEASVLFREGPILGNSSAAGALVQQLGLTNATFVSPLQYGQELTGPCIGEDDTTAFTAKLLSGVGGVTPEDNEFVFIYDGTALSIAAREGDLAPDGNGRIFADDPNHLNPTFNDGDTVFRADLLQASPSSSNEALISKLSSAPLAVFARKAQAVNSGTVAIPEFSSAVTYSDLTTQLALNRLGGVAYHVTLAGGTTGEVTDLNNRAVLAGQLNPSDGKLSSLRLIARRGDTQGLDTDEFVGYFGSNDNPACVGASINDNGDVVWASEIRRSGSSTGVSLWFRGNDVNSQPQMIVREGQGISVGTQTYTVANFCIDDFLYFLTENGDVVFRVKITEPNSTDPRNSIWRWKSASDELQLIVRENEMNSYRQKAVDSLISTHGVNRDGDVVFVTNVLNGGAANQDLWIDVNLSNGHDRRHLLAQGQLLPGHSNTTVTNIDLGAGNAPQTGVDGRGRVISDAGKVIADVQLNISGTSTPSLVILHPAAGTKDYLEVE